MRNLKMKKIILLLFLVGLIVLSLFYFLGQKNTENSFVEVSNQDLMQLLDSKEDSFVLYIGRPTCPQCEEIEPIVKDLNRKIYYYNTDDARKENEEEMNNLVKLLEVTMVPTMVYIENGNVKDKIAGIQDEQEIKEFLEANDM